MTPDIEAARAFFQRSGFRVTPRDVEALAAEFSRIRAEERAAAELLAIWCRKIARDALAAEVIVPSPPRATMENPNDD
jgi:hypothetical protein